MNYQNIIFSWEIVSKRMIPDTTFIWVRVVRLMLRGRIREMEPCGLGPLLIRRISP